ncbi:WecB/TagA/CpsF family glycosyltransferase [Arthrobacter bambusae]|uniref:WecB/TagA/CpsF family glycosyltransferase n=1 Tax=Arthrobacter bambusae TaxID=1338426 RepID=UPI002783513E|nr:WecB/TagA/CpsF family glycosyltransferase [Arthrobacter bambusae]MDQ0031446.1 N-acetylglucosaminyldiphosphoundecaprenol N-acetyl-beta-D-mannosaminyltransferase [Arthrobacter bambusae]MDQ0099666.1 N-acetylglucosaminyldiphosphoundecaprenol N-acetyl-beta-D-mannosaminyltransferase [Arthrobacter bambusae]
MRSQAFQLPAQELAGVPLVQASLRDATEELCRLAKVQGRPRGFSFHLVNAYTVALAHRDDRYAKLLATSTANFPDGKPLTWWKPRSGKRLQQVRGPRLFEEVMNVGRESDVRHFLLGATEETLSQLEASLQARHPGVNIVGSFSPPFRTMTQDEIRHQDKAIADSSAEIVWVGLGTPKQDWEVERIASELPVLAVAVGAAFDFSAGTKRRAPEWISKLGFEWLFRLLSEPRRLWRRYLIGNLVFLWAVARHRSRTDDSPEGVRVD